MITIKEEKFRQIIDYVIKEAEKGTPKEDIESNIELMLNEGLQEDIEQAKKEIREGDYEEWIPYEDKPERGILRIYKKGKLAKEIKDVKVNEGIG